MLRSFAGAHEEEKEESVGEVEKEESVGEVEKGESVRERGGEKGGGRRREKGTQRPHLGIAIDVV